VGAVRRYVVKRLLLVGPALFGIIALNFAVVQLAPGGPVESLVAHYRALAPVGVYRGGAVDVAQLNAQFGFDQPLLTRFWEMVRGYLTFNLGTSFTLGVPVAGLIWQRLPVSLSLGLWSTLMVYAVSVPLGIAKAVRDGSRFDVGSSVVILALYAVPGFLLASFLVVMLGQGGVFPVFPLRGLGDGVWDYAWHMVLPTVAMTAGGFASLTMLTKNSVLEEMNKLYVTTARAKGLSEMRVMLRHVLPNAMLLMVAGFPAALTAILFTSALLVEIIFSLQGLGQLGYTAALQRDYPVMFGTLYVYTLTGLILRLLGDLMVAVLDPRIDFDARE
jgi:microcin C transport system permease protein